jgi:hypothetical protein
MRYAACWQSKWMQAVDDATSALHSNVASLLLLGLVS